MNPIENLSELESLRGQLLIKDQIILDLCATVRAQAELLREQV